MARSLVQVHTTLPGDQIQPLLDRLAKINDHIKDYTDLEILPPEAETAAPPEGAPEPGTGESAPVPQ
jgi:hypothetical protein